MSDTTTAQAQATPPMPDFREGVVRAPATTFRDAPEVAEIGRQVIRQWHPHLAAANIRFLWREGGAWTSGGKTVLAKAGKLSSQVQFLSDDVDAVIIVDTERWEELDDAQRVALVDHECCHLAQATNKDDVPIYQVNGRPVLRVRAHDVTEFVEVIQRHGLWDIDLVHAGKAIRQIPMPLDEATVTITGPDGQTAETTVGGMRQAVTDLASRRGRRRQ